MVTEQISPQVRIVAIVGLVLALVAGGAMMVLNRRAAAEAAEPLPPPAVQSALLPVKAPATPAAKAAKPEPAAKASAPATPAPAPEPAAEPAPKPKPKPKPKPAVAANGLPMSVATALERHEAVVVSLIAPGGRVDALALAEARAGANAVGAGFVAVNVTNRTQGGALARLVGVQEPPAVLVYQSPETLKFRLEGFVDYETVAQAALSAGAPGRGVDVRDRWSREADRLCAETARTAPKIPPGATRAQILELAPAVMAAERRLLAGLSALRPPTDPGRRALAAQFVGSVERWVTAEARLLTSIRKNDLQGGVPNLVADQALAAQANGLAQKLDLPACHGVGA